jgi:hypothetical protein
VSCVKIGDRIYSTSTCINEIACAHVLASFSVFAVTPAASDGYISYQYGQVTTTVCCKNIMLLAQLFSPRSDLSGNAVGQDQEFLVIIAIK